MQVLCVSPKIKKKGMTTKIHKIKDFVILTEDYHTKEDMTKVVKLDQEMIGFVFYLSGTVLVDVLINKREESYLKKTGHSSSFYYSPNETIIKHQISNEKPLKKVSLFITPSKLFELLNNDEQIYKSEFKNLLNPMAPFVEGANFLLNPEMQIASQKIMDSKFTGITQNLFLESQATELLSHYLNQLIENDSRKNKLQHKDLDKLYYAK